MYSKKSMNTLHSFVSTNSTILLNLTNCARQYSISATGPTNSSSLLSCLYCTKHLEIRKKSLLYFVKNRLTFVYSHKPNHWINSSIRVLNYQDHLWDEDIHDNRVHSAKLRIDIKYKEQPPFVNCANKEEFDISKKDAPSQRYFLTTNIMVGHAGSSNFKVVSQMNAICPYRF